MSNKNFYTEKIAPWTTENTMWFRTSVKTGDNKRKFWELKAISASLHANSKTTVLQKSLCPLEKKKKHTKSQTQKTQTYPMSIVNSEQIWGSPLKLQMSDHSLPAWRAIPLNRKEALTRKC